MSCFRQLGKIQSSHGLAGRVRAPEAPGQVRGRIEPGGARDRNSRTNRAIAVKAGL